MGFVRLNSDNYVEKRKVLFTRYSHVNTVPFFQ